MVLLIVVMILNFAFANTSETLANPVPLQDSRAAVIPYRVTGMPVMINTAVAENRSTDSWLAYSITNKSQERIERLELQVFIIDGNGKLVSIEEGSSGKGISPGVTQEDRTRIAKPIEHNSMSIVTVSKAVGQSGVWSIDLSVKTGGCKPTKWPRLVGGLLRSLLDTRKVEAIGRTYKELL